MCIRDRSLVGRCAAKGAEGCKGNEGPEDPVSCWTLVNSDWDLVANKAGATRLGFAVLLKFFELEARFPRHAGEVPRAACRLRGGASETAQK